MSTAPSPPLGTRGRITHPLTPALVVTGMALAAAAALAAGQAPDLLAWVVLAVAGGYSISGSV